MKKCQVCFYVLRNNPIHQADEVAGSDHTDMVSENHIVSSNHTGKVYKIAFPITVVNFVNSAVVIYNIGHHGIAKGFLYHDGKNRSHRIQKSQLPRKYKITPGDEVL